MPLCEKHYYDDMGLVCGGCERPIIVGKCITMKGAKDTKFHVECFKCSYCKKNLAGQKYKYVLSTCDTWFQAVPMLSYNLIFFLGNKRQSLTVKSAI